MPYRTARGGPTESTLEPPHACVQGSKDCSLRSPAGRISYCIRLPGGPATGGVPRRELRFAPFRKSVLFVSLPFCWAVLAEYL